MLYEMVIGYLIFINLLSCIVCLIDKKKAQKNKWRIPEKVLFLLTFLGGGAGMYLTMKTIRHKTKHKRFMIGIPLVVFLQIAVIYFLMYKFF